MREREQEREAVKGNMFRGQRAVLAAAALALAVTIGCSKGNVQAAPGMPMPLVTVVKASVQDVPRYLDEIGRNAAFESVTVTPQVGGRIMERHFSDGENLEKGQLLFVIDPRPYQGAGGRRASGACPGKGRAGSGEDSVRARRRGDWRARDFEAGLRHQEEHCRCG